MDEPLLFVNIGWMVAYKGPTNDPTIGGHGWLKSHDYGHEAWNFLPHQGKLYGYVPRSARINLRRLGSALKDDEFTGVTVVWVARNPRDKVTYVAGWYRNALIHRESNHFKIQRAKGQVIEYQIEAPNDGAKLLTPDQRTLKVPTAKLKGNLGQSPVWYGNTEFVAQVRAYLKADGVIQEPKKKKASGTPRQLDPETRKLVELAAVRHAIDYYTSRAGGNRTVTSVERDNAGWDLTVTGGDVTLKVEVKGLSGSNLCVASGMYALTRIRVDHDDSVVISATKDPLSEVGILSLPDGSAVVLQPRSLIGVLSSKDKPVRITSHWRLFSLHAWVTLQLRYLVFHGPTALIVKGCRGIRVENSESGRRINQAATIGFSANVSYSTSRCETFAAYLMGKQELLNDNFSGTPGFYIYEEMPHAGERGGITGRGLEGVTDSLLKIFGV